MPALDYPRYCQIIHRAIKGRLEGVHQVGPTESQYEGYKVWHLSVIIPARQWIHVRTFREAGFSVFPSTEDAKIADVATLNIVADDDSSCLLSYAITRQHDTKISITTYEKS